MEPRALPDGQASFNVPGDALTRRAPSWHQSEPGKPNAPAKEIGFKDPQPRRVRFCGADTAGQLTPINRGYFMRRSRDFSVGSSSLQVSSRCRTDEVQLAQACLGMPVLSRASVGRHCPLPILPSCCCSCPLQGVQNGLQTLPTCSGQL